ncbi:hypothetical protein [Clostridium senegalense]|uniref:hypothetical protein n=1 Tax=Clostridium senegalense TaxID=1465809 RepID=UPI00028A3E73|nr:hypothetical protein [Clostridium senegalense]
MKKSTIFIIICAIISISIVVVYKYNQGKEDSKTESNESVRLEQSLGENSKKNEKELSKNNPETKEKQSENEFQNTEEANEEGNSTVIKNDNIKSLNDIKNLDEISSLEIIDSGIEDIDKLNEKIISQF